jgi:cell division protein YceG involved in septum cleavage
VVSKVAIGFVVDDAIACIRLLLALLRVLREEEETTFLIRPRSDDEDIFEDLRKNLISKSKKTLSWSSSILLFAQY